MPTPSPQPPRRPAAAPSTHGSEFDWATLGVNFIFIVGLLLLIAQIVPTAFAIHLHPFIVIPLLGVGANLVLLIMVLRRHSQAQPVLWFGLFTLFNLLWGGFEFMQRLATTPEGDLFWGRIIFATAAFLPAFFYLFVRGYAERSRPSGGSVVVPTVIVGFTSVIAFLISANGVLPPPAPELHQAWGYPAPSTHVALMYITWTSLLSALAIGRLIIFHREATSRKDRQQTLVLIISAALLAFVAGFTSVILPALHIYALPPLGVFANAVFAASVIYTIHKYDTFSINMNQISHTVLATMAEAVVVTDRHYQILYANQAAELLLGQAGHPLANHDLSTILDQQLGAFQSRWEAQLASPNSQVASIEVPLKIAQRKLTIRLQVSLVADTQPGYAFVLSDITELKAYSQQAISQTSELVLANKHLQSSQATMMNLLDDARDLETQLKREKASIQRKVTRATAELRATQVRLEASINSLNVGYLMTDVDGSLLTINGAAQAIIARGVGLQPSQLLVDIKTFESILARTFDLGAKIKQCLHHGKMIKQTNIPLRDSVLSIFLAPIIDHSSGEPRPLGVVVLIDDITEDIAMQRSRDEFFSIASHELRTPLTAIRGNAQMIHDYYSENFKDPQLKEMLNDIHDSSVRLISIVNDFLDTSRLEQGRMKFKPTVFSPMSLLQAVLREYKSAGMNPALYLKIKQPGHAIPSVFADYDRLKQVVINLVGNALKFTDKGGITLSLNATDKQVVIAVTDTGKGIPADSRPLLFRKFQQASNNLLVRDSTKSTGLGLYISKLIMASMHGTIELEHSEVDKGSTFVVTVPIASAKQLKLKRDETNHST